MGARRWAGGGFVVSVAGLLAGALGGVDCDAPRYQSVAGRASTVTITGYDDQYAATVCAFQQTRDPSISATLGCVTPDSLNPQTSCSTTFYPFSITVTLLSHNDYWFKSGNQPEFTKVFVSRSGTNGGLYTVTDDVSSGPSDELDTCARSWLQTNASVAPLVYFNGQVPTDLDCSSATRSYAGCPFTCNVPEGCDAAYGRRQAEFYASGYRVNLDSQATSDTLYDHFGANASTGAPSGDWTYQDDSGTCVGGTNNGALCDLESQCPGGYCSNSYILLRRNYLTGDSNKIKRGENRRNSLVEAYLKMKAVNSSNQEIGLASRFYDANNYLVFMVREYGGDYAWFHKFQGGAFSVIATSQPSLNLLSWVRLGFEVRDNGSYSTTGSFVPNGTCKLNGFVNGANVLSTSSATCSFAPTGRYGPYSYYNSSAQFWDLDVFVCDSSGCIK